MFKINIADSKERDPNRYILSEMKPYYVLKYLVHVVNAKKDEHGLINLAELKQVLDEKGGYASIGTSLRLFSNIYQFVPQLNYSSNDRSA